jgi:hypothetical protein
MPIAPRPASRFLNRVGFDARGVNGGCGDALPKIDAMSSSQNTPPGGGVPTVPRRTD